MADTRIAALDTRIAELSTRASELGATDREIRSLGGNVAETKSNPILEQARIESAPTVLPTLDSFEKSMLDVQAALESTSARIATSITSLEEGALKSTTATDVITSSIESIAGASKIVALATDTAALQAQSATMNAFKAAGGLEAQQQLIGELATDSARVSDLLDEKLDIADDEHTGIGIIDNIINDFRSIQLDSEISAAERKQASTSRELSNINASTESANQSALLTQQKITDATIQANQEQIASTATFQVAKAEIQNIGTNASAVNAILTADQRRVTNLQQQLASEEQKENRAIRMEVHEQGKKRAIQLLAQWNSGKQSRSLALQQQKLALKTAIATTPSGIAATLARNEKLVKDIADQELLEESIVTSIQTAQSLAGLTVEDTQLIIAGLESTGDRKKKYERLLEIGGRPNPIIAATPAEAQLNYATIDVSGTGTSSKARDILDDVARIQAEDLAKPGATVPKTEEAIIADFNTRASVFMQVKAADIRTGDRSNPYHGAPFSTLEISRSIQDTALYQKVLKAKEMKELNPELILESAIAAVQAKAITPEEAATGIDAIFTQAALLNNTDEGGFRRVGLANQTTYNVVLERDPTGFELLKSGGSALLQAPQLLVATVSDVLSEKDKRTNLRDRFDKIKERFSTVDLMNTTMVQNHIVKLLSAQKPTTESTP